MRMSESGKAEEKSLAVLDGDGRNKVKIYRRAYRSRTASKYFDYEASGRVRNKKIQRFLYFAFTSID